MKKYNHESGFSLVEVMIAAAIGAAVLVGVATMFKNHQNTLKSMYQRSELIEFKNMLTQSLAPTDVCSWQLKDKNIDTAGVTTTNPSSTVLNIPILYRGQDVNSAVLAKPGERLPNTTTGIKVDKILFRGITATGIPNEYSGYYEFLLDRESLAGPIKPVRHYQTFRVDSATQKIDSCKSIIDYKLIDVADASCVSSPKNCTAVAKCPSDYKLVGCWNEETEGSTWEVKRNVPPDGHDECICRGTGGNCWFAVATCLKI